MHKGLILGAPTKQKLKKILLVKFSGTDQTDYSVSAGEMAKILLHKLKTAYIKAKSLQSKSTDT